MLSICRKKREGASELMTSEPFLEFKLNKLYVSKNRPHAFCNQGNNKLMIFLIRDSKVIMTLNSTKKCFVRV